MHAAEVMSAIHRAREGEACGPAGLAACRALVQRKGAGHCFASPQIPEGRNFSLIVFSFSLVKLCYSRGSLQENSVTTASIGTFDNPYTGKAFKEALVPCLEALVNEEDCFLDAQGKCRIYVKFANGRLATVEAFDEDQADEVEALLVHEVKHQQLRAHWTAVSAAIVFGIAFSFEYKKRDGTPTRLILHKCEEHAGDDFVQGIVANMQASLEYDALGDISEKMQAGFKRLEKLIIKK